MTKARRDWQQLALDEYITFDGRDFLLEATPGAGKTFFMGDVGEMHLSQNDADAIIVVVPSLTLRRQIAKAFHTDFAIELDPNWNGDSRLVRSKFVGAVVSNQWLGNNPGVMRHHVSHQKTFVVIDEVHHGNDDKSWGKAWQYAFEPGTVIRRLLTSGTPFRSDGGKIPFVPYDGKIAKPNFTYNYGDALRDEVVRAIYFNHRGGLMRWDSEDGEQQATFEEELDKLGQSRRLRTALKADSDHIGGLLAYPITRLQELREEDHDAGCLVNAMDQDHARALTKRIEKVYGMRPLLAISDEENADEIIERFKESNEPVLVTVRMVSEGVDIPRLRTLCYATNVVTEMNFIQTHGRLVRIEPGHDDPTGFMSIPDDPRLREYALKMELPREKQLRDREERERQEDFDTDGKGTKSMFFNPISASNKDAGATAAGNRFTPEEYAFANSVRMTLPHASGISVELLTLALKNAGQLHIGTGTTSEGEATEPLFEELKRLRKRNNSLVGQIYYKTGLEYKDINYQLNAASGITKMPLCDDVDKLLRRLDLARRWYLEGIPPGVNNQ